MEDVKWVLDSSPTWAFVCVRESEAVQVEEQLAVASSQTEDDGLLPPLQIPQAGVLGGDVSL